MAKAAPPRDAVTAVVPVHNAADRLEKLLPAWADGLARTGREYELLVVDDGSTDATPAVLAKFAPPRVRNLRVLRHDTRRGFGAALRTALAEAKHPLFFYTATDYPYTPADLRRLLERIDVRDELFGRQPDLISGCRTGRPAPLVLKWAGRAWRLFLRVAVGMPMDPPAAWQGWREWAYGGYVGWVFGVPLADVNSAFKLYRTAFLRRFPIQSDGDFVHAELVAKATFLTSIMDELPLTPRPDPIPPRHMVAGEMRRVFAYPQFVHPAAEPPPAAAPAVQVETPPAPPPDAAPSSPPARLAVVPVE